LTTLAILSLLSSTFIMGCSSSEDTKTTNIISSKEVLANQNVRIAIAKSIDKEGYVDVILNDGSQATNNFTTTGLAINDGVDYTELTKDFGHAYNIDEAKEHWEMAKEELGFDEVSINLLTSDTDNAKKTSEFIQAEVSILEGLNLTITNMPFGQRIEKESVGDFDISYTGWGADYPDPTSFLKTMETGGKYAAQVGYDNEEYNDLLKEAVSSTDTTEAYEKFAEAEEMMLNDTYLIPLFYSGRSYAEKEYVSGIINHSWGVDHTYKYADVDKEEKILNLLNVSDIPTMDVSQSNNSVSYRAINNTMEGLTRIDENGEVIMAGATDYTVSEDGLVWTFELNEKAVWSNGDKVTAHDYKYSWDRTVNPDTGAQYSYMLDDIDSWQVIDDYTFEVNLKYPLSYFAEFVSFPLLFPQNQAFVESMGDSYGTSVETQVYNGPFTLSVWKMEDAFAFSKNDTYWDKDNVALDLINFKVVKDDGTAINLYKNGDVDRVLLASEYVDEFKDTNEFGSWLEAATFMLQINASNQK
ncbi:MAG: ABC transporter substrate-binding protein, partial [Peptostreptococcaceae bacterium]